MGNLIVGGIVLLIVVLAIGYIVKEKKKGTKCIGCSAGGSCSSCSSCSDTHTDEHSNCNCDAEEADHANYHNH